MEKGYVYILTNDSFREDWVKIGKSSRPVDVRSKELDNTAVPLPFNIYATLETARYSQVERLIHKTIDRLTDLRIRQNREFFNVSPEVALDMLVDIAKVTDDAVITIYKDNKPFQVLDSEEPRKPRDLGKPEVNKKRACNFRFSMIEREGRLCKLSARRAKSDDVVLPDFFKEIDLTVRNISFFAWIDSHVP